LISDHEFAFSPPAFFSFFARGKIIRILRLRHLFPASGAQTSNKKKSMLAYFVASHGSNQSISPSSQHNIYQQYQQQVPVLAQSGARSRSQLLPASDAATAQSTKKRQRKQAAPPVPVLCNRMHLGFGAALTSPTELIS
jgi:hypothetical protein